MCASSVRVPTVFTDDRAGRISVRSALLVGNLGRLGRLAKGHGVSGCETKTVKASQIRDNDSPCASKSSRVTDRSTSLRQCYRSRPPECPCGVRLDRQIPSVRSRNRLLTHFQMYTPTLGPPPNCIPLIRGRWAHESVGYSHLGNARIPPLPLTEESRTYPRRRAQTD